MKQSNDWKAAPIDDKQMAARRRYLDHLEERTGYDAGSHGIVKPSEDPLGNSSSDPDDLPEIDGGYATAPRWYWWLQDQLGTGWTADVQGWALFFALGFVVALLVAVAGLALTR